jgi:hypothetical protein
MLKPSKKIKSFKEQIKEDYPDTGIVGVKIIREKEKQKRAKDAFDATKSEELKSLKNKDSIPFKNVDIDRMNSMNRNFE